MTPSLLDIEPSFGVHQLSVWSCGGGRQSTAIAGLIVQGRLPKPDYAIMVNTGRERSSTWRYVNAVLIPELARVGIPLEIISKEKYATVDLWGGKDGKTLLLPVFTDQSGAIGKMTNFCSGEWKRRVIERYMRDVHRVRSWVSWLGMSTDETKRVRIRETESGNLNRYPLVYDVPMSTDECVRFIKEELGWPKAPKSTCWTCPNQSDEQWLEMKQNDPDDFAKAVALDKANRLIDPNAFLHKSCVPLDEVDFETLCTQKAEASTGKDGCDSGYCFT